MPARKKDSDGGLTSVGRQAQKHCNYGDEWKRGSADLSSSPRSIWCEGRSL